MSAKRVIHEVQTWKKTGATINCFGNRGVCTKRMHKHNDHTYVQYMLNDWRPRWKIYQVYDLKVKNNYKLGLCIPYSLWKVENK